MVYAQAHYAPGFGERYVKETPLPTLSEAQQRVRNYSTPILRLGGTFLATAYGDADDIVSRVLTGPTTSYGAIFAAGRGYSPSTLTDSAHADFVGSRVWVQRTVISGFHFGQPDYWYAFAGDPKRTPGGGASGPEMTRLSGSDRYATAAAISSDTFARGVPVAYVATGAAFPDALAAGAAAAHHDGPVLLVTVSGVPQATATELSRLAPSTIKVVGGPSVVSDDVLQTLRAYATSGVVERIAGANRYATAASVSADTFASQVPVAYVATGQTFPDALAGVAAAGKSNGPILLVKGDAVPAETVSELKRLQPGRIVVLGSAAVVSEAVAANLAAYAIGGGVSRLAGADRYATAVAVSSGTFTGGSSTAFIATGLTFPDALGGGPVAGGLPGPLLLVPGTFVPASVAAELRRLDPDAVVLLGGPSAVSDAVASQISNLLGN